MSCDDSGDFTVWCNHYWCRYLDIFRNVDVLTSENLLNISVGFVTAFIAALLVVKAMVKFVEKHTLKVFAWYRLVLDSIILFVF
jgi:undecaprenyl-diphosphatase